MKKLSLSALVAGFALTAGAALAGPMDLVTTGCKENFRKGLTTHSICFTAYEPYATGHYKKLKCRDPYTGLRYKQVKSFWHGSKMVLRCTPN
ncbi:hypothetical protein [Sagittula sp. SSi028]|uniref:hypothetical protein n=1 Tax=Sagittula sp. SSi028 TaxID=3400636 RepID=UPI003AF8EB4A